MIIVVMMMMKMALQVKRQPAQLPIAINRKASYDLWVSCRPNLGCNGGEEKSVLVMAVVHVMSLMDFLQNICTICSKIKQKQHH